jgi:hypothetical protein
MAKIALLDPVESPDGSEQVPILKGGVAKRASLAQLVATAMVLKGNGPPAAGAGVLGALYLDVAAINGVTLYGPKAVGGWGAGIPIETFAAFLRRIYGLAPETTEAHAIETALISATGTIVATTGASAAAAAASAAAALASAAAAAVSAGNAAADRTQTGIDRTAVAGDRAFVENLIAQGVLSTYLSTADALSNGVLDYAITTPSSGGANAVYQLTLTGGGGTGATARALVTGGAVTKVTRQQKGKNYTSAPAVTAPIAGAVITAIIGANTVDGDIFLVPENGSMSVYKNVAGAAVFQFSFGQTVEHGIHCERSAGVAVGTYVGGHDLPALTWTRLHARVVKGGGTCTAVIIVDGRPVYGPVNVTPEGALLTGLSISATLGSRLEIALAGTNTTMTEISVKLMGTPL